MELFDRLCIPETVLIRVEYHCQEVDEASANQEARAEPVTILFLDRIPTN